MKCEREQAEKKRGGWGMKEKGREGGFVWTWTLRGSRKPSLSDPFGHMAPSARRLDPRVDMVITSIFF